MNKKVLIILCSVSLVLLLTSFGFAQPPDKQWAVGARLSYYDPQSTNDIPSGGTFDPDAAALFEGNLTWFPINTVSLEFAVGYTKTTGHLSEPGIDMDFVDIKQIPLQLTGRYHWWFSNSTMSLSAGGGIGYYLNDASATSEAQAVAPNLSFDADNSFGFHLAGGYEWLFTESWGFNVDVKYIWNDIDFTGSDPTDPPPETTNIDYNTLSIGLGIKYYF